MSKMNITENPKEWLKERWSKRSASCVILLIPEYNHVHMLVRETWRTDTQGEVRVRGVSLGKVSRDKCPGQGALWPWEPRRNKDGICPSRILGYWVCLLNLERIDICLELVCGNVVELPCGTDPVFHSSKGFSKLTAALTWLSATLEAKRIAVSNHRKMVLRSENPTRSFLA